MDNIKFLEAVEAAKLRQKGLNGSVGTQNEKLIHAALKYYYAPYSDEHEIRIGKFYADAVNENGIFEIQSRALYTLKEKLSAFTKAAGVTVVYPVPAKTGTAYINSETGELIKEPVFRKENRNIKIFEELYSLRDFLQNKRLTIILAYLKIEKIVLVKGREIPNIKSRGVRKRLDIRKIPLELMDEKRFSGSEDYRTFLPEKPVPEKFTKNEFLEICGDSRSSLRLEVLRAAGVIRHIDTDKRRYVYSLNSGNEYDGNAEEYTGGIEFMEELNSYD